MLWIEETPHARRTAAAGAAMKDDNRLPVGIATLLYIYSMIAADFHHGLSKWLASRVKPTAPVFAGLAGIFAHGTFYLC